MEVIQGRLETKAMLPELVDNHRMIKDKVQLDHVLFFIRNVIIRDRVQKFVRIHLTCQKISRQRVSKFQKDGKLKFTYQIPIRVRK